MQKIVHKTPSELASELREMFASEHGVTTATAIAKLTGMTQSTIYRNLWDNPKRVTRTLTKLCENYRITLERPARTDIGACPTLAEAIDQTWDGTRGHGEALAKLIIAAREIGKSDKR